MTTTRPHFSTRALLGNVLRVAGSKALADTTHGVCVVVAEDLTEVYGSFCDAIENAAKVFDFNGAAMILEDGVLYHVRELTGEEKSEWPGMRWGVVEIPVVEV